MSKKGAVGYEIITDYLAGKFSRTEAAQMLEVRERTITRMARRIREKGLSGAVHANRGRAPAFKLPAIFNAQVMKTMKEKYFDFNMTHALEMLEGQHKIEVSYCELERGLIGRQGD